MTGVQTCALPIYGVVIHGTYEHAPTNIGNNVSIGHNATVHGCTLHDNVLVGIGAVVMDNCVVKEYSIIAAGAIVLENTVIESGSIYAGIPAKKVKTVSQKQMKGLIENATDNYLMYAGWFREE